MNIKNFKKKYKLYKVSDRLILLRIKHVLFLFSLYNIPKEFLTSYFNFFASTLDGKLPIVWWSERQVKKFKEEFIEKN